MTGVTHQIIALLAALWFLTGNPQPLGPWLALLAAIAVMTGALTPDLDQPAANLWRRLLGGRALGRVFNAFSGGHRHLTHSIAGILAVAWGMKWGINELLVPQYHDAALLIWLAFLIGYISHPIADTFTDKGVPWLWPFKWHLRLPPGPEEVRITTGSFVEVILLRGALLICAGLILSSRWPEIVSFIKP